MNHIMDIDECNIVDDPMSTSASKDDDDDDDDDVGSSTNITTTCSSKNRTRTHLSSSCLLPIVSAFSMSLSLPFSSSQSQSSFTNNNTTSSSSKQNACFPPFHHRRSSSNPTTVVEQHANAVLNPCTFMMKSLAQNNDNREKKRFIRRIDSFSLEQALYFEPYQESEIKNELLKALRSSNVDQLRSLILFQDDEKNNNSRSTSLLLLQDVKTCNQFGENLLHLACRMGISREVVIFLSDDCQVPLNVRDKFGRTPLHNSCMSTVPNFHNIEFVILKAPRMLLFEDDNGKIPFELIPTQCFEWWTQFLLSYEEGGEKNILLQAFQAIP